MEPDRTSLDARRIASRAFFDRPAPDLARALLGTLLLAHTPEGPAAGIIVEVEAYLRHGDAAAHSARGRTPATASLFAGPGTLYVHPMRRRCGLDIVAREGSVLIRALEPAVGLALMARRRGKDSPRLLARGPARLTEALGITRAFDGLDLTAADCPVALAAPTGPPGPYTETTRIGLTRAVDLALRFHLAGNVWVSRRKRDQKNA